MTQPIASPAPTTATVPATLPPPPPPATPRPINQLIRRRAWTEPTARAWWLGAIAILLLILIYASDRSWSWHVQNRLITAGTPVSAKVVEANGLAISSESVPPNSPVVLEFDWHGQTQQVNGFLEDRVEYIRIASQVPIRVDPDDPTNWTYRTQPTSLLEALMLGLWLLPIPPLLLGAAYLTQKSILKTWQFGQAALAVVVDRRQIPIAPRCYTVRCALTDGRDKRLHPVHIPPAKSPLKKSDPLWILLPSRYGRSRSIAVIWFT